MMQLKTGARLRVPGGFLPHTATLHDGANLVGADIVEVAPAYDHAEITAIAAAHVMYDLVTLMARTLEG